MVVDQTPVRAGYDIYSAPQDNRLLARHRRHVPPIIAPGFLEPRTPRRTSKLPQPPAGSTTAGLASTHDASRSPVRATIWWARLRPWAPCSSPPQTSSVSRSPTADLIHQPGGHHVASYHPPPGQGIGASRTLNHIWPSTPQPVERISPDAATTSSWMRRRGRTMVSSIR